MLVIMERRGKSAALGYPTRGTGPRPAGRGVLPQEGPIKCEAEHRPWALVQWEKPWPLVQSTATFMD